MTLDLREVIGVPGLSLGFEFEPDINTLVFDSIIGIDDVPYVTGKIQNRTGLLSFEAELEASVICICARCLTRFTRDISRTIKVDLSENEEAGDDPGCYYIEGAALDPNDIISTELLLDLEQRQLCREDCKGLCMQCGADLNEGECDCKPEVDPRLAALSQLLDDSGDAD